VSADPICGQRRSSFYAECRSVFLASPPCRWCCRVPIRFVCSSLSALQQVLPSIPPVDFSCAAIDADWSCRQVSLCLRGHRSCCVPVSLLSALDLDVQLESMLSAFGFPVPVKNLCALVLCSSGFDFVLCCRLKLVTSPALIKCCSSKSTFLIACELFVLPR
jgi:hypothetical protein